LTANDTDAETQGQLTVIDVSAATQYGAAFGVLSAVLQVFIPFRRYAPILKALTLALLAYVASLFIIEIPWGEVAVGTLLLKLSLKPEYIVAVVAVFLLQASLRLPRGRRPIQIDFVGSVLVIAGVSLLWPSLLPAFGVMTTLVDWVSPVAASATDAVVATLKARLAIVIAVAAFLVATPVALYLALRED